MLKKTQHGSSWLCGLATLGIIFGVACTSQSAKAKPSYLQKDPPSPGVMAKVNGQELKIEDLIGDEKLAYIEIKKREHDFLMERLNAIVREKLLGEEAKKAGMPLQEFIDKKIVGKEIKISDADYKGFVKAKQIPDSQINDALKEKIYAYMKEKKKEDLLQEHIAKLTKSSPVEVYFKKPKAEVQVEVGNGPVWGKKDAPVTIVEFSDFQCPYCSRGAETVNEIKKKYGNKVRIAFRHFPLGFHQRARPSAEASLCMNDQSSDKFWKFHDLAFKNQKSLEDKDLESYAKQAGGDMTKYKQCLESKKFAQAVQADMDYADKVGVKSTPTFFINGEIVAGALPIEQFSEIIDEAIASKK